MDSDFPWIYVAMLFFAFIAWVRSRIEESSEKRRAIREARQRRSERAEPEPDYESPYRQSSSEPHEASAATSAEADLQNVPEGPTSFRDLYRELLEARQEESEEPATVRRPPPLPAGRSAEAGDAEGVGAVSPLLQGNAIGSPTGLDSASGLHVHRRRGGNGIVRRVISDVQRRGSVQRAFILKEVLDNPKGLQ